MSLNEGLGAVTEKNVPLISDSLSYNKLNAAKHANGTDWWIIHLQDHNNKYSRVLLNEEGFSEVQEQMIGDTLDGDSGNSTFSPDGSKFIVSTSEDYIHVFDFDRATGLLSNQRKVITEIPVDFDTLAVSPNSRFLYLSNIHSLHQFDLLADDIEESQILIDTFDGFSSPFPAQFFQPRLAPNCKIYLTTPSTTNVLHVINHPDRKGKACDFKQHAIDLPTLHGLGSIPFYPNYRLGATPSYPCDSTIVLPTAIFSPPQP